MAGYVAASSAGAAATAARRRREREEEEEMTTYGGNDLDGWEFKIIRSAFGRFSSAEAVRTVSEEEAKAGWELLEKFDNSRLRFKRRIERRAQDQHLDIDPYRTVIGIGELGIVLTIVGAIIAVIGVVLLLQSH